MIDPVTAIRPDPARSGTGTTTLRAGTVVSSAGVGPGWVRWRDDRILAVGVGNPPENDGDGGTLLDLGADAVVVPGFVDAHVHGGGGHTLTTDDPAHALAAVAFHRRHGTTSTMASLVTADPATLRRQVAALGELTASGDVIGVHLEGPWLAAGRCGAHDPALLRDPDPAELDALLGTGVIAMVTLAPERAGGLDAIRRVVAAGALAAVGHTDTDLAGTVAAIEAGARVGTHLFNAMPPVHHRDPGPIVALLDDERVTVELVCDGLHVHPALWDTVVAAAGAHRVAAVTDAMVAAGMPDGSYRLGGLDVDVRDGQARLAGPGNIAGSTATMDALFANIVAHAAGPRSAALARAVQLCSTTPAATLGLTDVGLLAPGLRADLVVLGPDAGADPDTTPTAARYTVRAVYRAGTEVAGVVPTAAGSTS